MPLSSSGVAHVSRAAEWLGLSVAVANVTSLADLADSERRNSQAALGGGRNGASAMRMLRAGAAVHYPSLVVLKDRRVVGPAIVGFKTDSTYAELLRQRLINDGGTRPISDPASVFSQSRSWPVKETNSTRDIVLKGKAGAYFRYVAGRRAITFALQLETGILRFADSVALPAVGYVDLIPTPDGRMFVTPRPRRKGLEWYSVTEVFNSASKGPLGPMFVDSDMKDQYPSIGIIRQTGKGGDTETVYRVVTSWFDRVIFRDYRVRFRDGEPKSIKPVSRASPACNGYALSLPIISHDGRELAARDEQTGTTKVFYLYNGRECIEVIDLNLPTGKVAWSQDGRRIAFAIPKGTLNDGRRTLWINSRTDTAEAGVFIYDRDSIAVFRVAGSAGVRRLTFPEFVGNDSLILVMDEPDSTITRFRFFALCSTGLCNEGSRRSASAIER